MIDHLFPSILAAANTELVREWNFTAADVFWRLAFVTFLIFLNGFFVAAEFAIVKVRDSQLQEAAEEGNMRAKAARGMVKHLDSYLSATQLGITLASIGLGMTAEPMLAQMIEPLLFKFGIESESMVRSTAFGIAFTMITFLHVVLGELMPKSVAIRKAFATTLWVHMPLHMFQWVLKPVIFLFNGTANWLLKVLFKLDPVEEGERVHSEEELKHIVAESERSEEVTETEKNIVLNALSLNDRYVRDLMTPRRLVVSLDTNESFEDNLKIALESKHTRFPLVEGHLDQSVGLIHIKDLLHLTQVEGEKDLRSIRRELLLVPEMMPIDKLLRYFLEKQAHMAMALDEFGGGVGIVTLDNIFEEMVGDINDEFDVAEKPRLIMINANEFEVQGSVNLYEINEETDLDLESDEVATIGGYVTHELGHFPDPGETLEIEGYLVTVKEVEDRRVISLHFKRI